MSFQRTGLIIRVSGKIEQFRYDNNDKSFFYADLLSASFTDHMALDWLDETGRNVALICGNIYEGIAWNSLASDIAGVDIYGDCILTDCNKSLAESDFYDILGKSVKYHHSHPSNPMFKDLLDILTTRR